MKNGFSLKRLSILSLCMIGIGAFALIGKDKPTAADEMTVAASAFLDSLTAEQRKQASFGFDDPHRTAWFFTPQQNAERQSTRKGIPLESLNAKQREAALQLLKAGTSKSGYEQAETIMSLEAVLRDSEKNGRMVRNPNWYFISIFGTPGMTTQWGWRFEGHHLSISFTMDRGKVLSPTPFFYGANPAIVKGGAKDGNKTISEVQELTGKLIANLTADQRKIAHQAKHFPEIAENTPAATLTKPVGLDAGQFTPAQKEMLLAILRAYTNRMNSEIGATEYQKVLDGGVDKVYFAYSGSELYKTGTPFTYQIQGPTFLVQFLNVQADGNGNPNNHIHSSWRKIPADFGISK
ncbi:MAG: DUF3500 domain-containing protein [Zavarzinella sp.]